MPALPAPPPPAAKCEHGLPRTACSVCNQAPSPPAVAIPPAPTLAPPGPAAPVPLPVAIPPAPALAPPPGAGAPAALPSPPQAAGRIVTSYAVATFALANVEVQVAPHGRSKCVACGIQVGAGATRFMVSFLAPWGEGQRFACLLCGVPKFSTLSLQSVGDDLAVLRGSSRLSSAATERLRARVKSELQKREAAQG